MATRRYVLTVLLSFAGALAWPLKLAAQRCRALVAADLGPFYPTEPIPDTTDLIPGKGPPPGRILYFAGRVLTAGCRPAGGVSVEIWQCDAGGEYKHPRAARTTALRENFLYFAKTVSRADGSFVFRTLRPAPYRFMGIERAPHIHIRLVAPGQPPLVTEMYFADEPDAALQAGDRVFQSRGPHRRELVTTIVSAATVQTRLGRAPEEDALACEYDLVLGEI